LLFDKAIRSLEETTYIGTPFGNTVKAALSGHCQTRNAATIFTALLQLRKAGYNITDEAVARGFARVCDMTGLAGRWMRLSDSPLTIADTGHNIGGWQYLAPALESWQHGKLRCILGFVNDKDISSILSLLPRDAVYYFTRASVPRALDPETLQCIAAGNGIDGNIYPDVACAIAAARADASPRDLIFIGGSTFVVADAIAPLR
ncbi:MAG: bifunctional folylpolyglutamate synthase/dihydrofolate synthase, partial [Muribaculaceae bacterium]|nr:bifunctional folylpolyglutamate synthase/dihydrofolate synthase [Muribaculaceae bacterium]